MNDPMTPKDYRNVRKAMKRLVECFRPVHELDGNARAYEERLKRRIGEFHGAEIAVAYGVLIALAEVEDTGLEITVFHQALKTIQAVRQLPPDGEA